MQISNLFEQSVFSDETCVQYMSYTTAEYLF